MRPLTDFQYPVKRPREPVVRKTRTVHDASKCVGLPNVRRPEPTLRTPERFAYTGKAQVAGSSMAQGFVYSHASVFGTGNPRTIGASGGERRIVARRNVSNMRPLTD